MNSVTDTLDIPNLPIDEHMQYPISTDIVAEMVDTLLLEGGHTPLRYVKSSLNASPGSILSSEQIKRAKGLGFPEERIRALEYVTQLSHNTLSVIIDPNQGFRKAADYLNSIVISLVSQKPYAFAENTIPKAEIQLLIEHVFSPENMKYGIPYIMPYFLSFLNPSLAEQTINVRFLTGLLDFWHQLGRSHNFFGKIPNEYLIEMNVFECYTAYRDAGCWYFTVPLITEKNFLFGGDYEVDPDHDFPDTFARIGMHQGSEGDIDLDVGHYETLFVLGGTAYRFLKPADKGLRTFIRKHYQFLSQEGNTPWENLKTGEEGIWQGAKRIFDKMIEQNTAMVSQNPKPRKSNKQSKKPTAISISSGGYLGSIIEPLIVYPKPNILENLKTQLIGNKTQQKFAISELCDNIPENARLCIGEYVVRGDGKHLLWREERYSKEDSISFSSIPLGRTQEFVFCFLGEKDSRVPSKNLPYTSITVTSPKERKVSDVVKAIPARTQVALTVSKESAPSVVISQAIPSISESSPTEDFAIELLDSLDSIDVTRLNPQFLLLRTREDFQIEYDVNNRQFRKMNAPDGVDMNELVNILGDDFDRLIGVFIQNEAEKNNQETISTLTFAYLFLREKFIEFGDVSELGIKKSFGLTRVGNKCGAQIFIGEPSYKAFFNGFKEICLSQYGIYLDLQEVKNSGEVQLTLSLKGKGGICATINSQKDVPYFAFSDMGNMDSRVSERAKDTLTNILFFLSGAGKVINPSAKAIVMPGGYTISREGCISLYRRNFGSLSDEGTKGKRDEIERIEDLIQRIENGGRIKVCSGVSLQDISIPGKNITERVPVYAIHSCRDSKVKELLENAPNDFRFVHRDEYLAFTSNGTGHANVYEHIRLTPRLQKYLALRMAYAISSKLGYNDIKNPIPEGPKRFMMQAWNGFDGATQQKFLSCFEEQVNGSVTRALSIQDVSGKTVFRTLLDSLEENNIKILHHSPGLISIGKVREHLKNSTKPASEVVL